MPNKCIGRGIPLKRDSLYGERPSCIFPGLTRSRPDRTGVFLQFTAANSSSFFKRRWQIDGLNRFPSTIAKAFWMVPTPASYADVI
jgi:hypothetical protein